MLFNKTDLKYTLRLLIKKPAFALLSIVVLAGGLGLSIFSFTVLYTTLYKPLPLTNGDSIYKVCAGTKGGICIPFRPYEFSQFRDEITLLDQVGVYSPSDATIIHNDNLAVAELMRTEWNMFQLSETKAILGRTLQDFDQAAGAEPVAVIAYDMWQTLFDGSPDAIDTVVNIQNVPTKIVGVMPEGYRFPAVSQLWLPINHELLNPVENYSGFIYAYGMLKDGMTEDQASQEMASIMSRNRQRYPANDSESVVDQEGSAYIVSFPAGMIGGLDALILIGAATFLVGSIFLLASINVGTLLLARTNERLKDISIRVALGAPRKRLLLQTMGESVAISILGGILALLFASVTMELVNLFFSSLEAAAFPFWMVFHTDGSTILGAVAFVLLTILFTSALPCWRIINGDFNSVMRDGTRGAVGLKSGRVSRALAVTSISIISLLLFLGALYSGEMLNLKSSVSATDIDHLINVEVAFDSKRYSAEQKMQWYRRFDERLTLENSISEVQIHSEYFQWLVEREGQSANGGIETVNASLNYLFASSDSQSKSGRTLLEGRYLNDLDNDLSSPAVAVISQTLANNLWPIESAIDQRLRLNSRDPEVENSWVRIVGIVTDNPDPDSPLVQLSKSELRMSLSQTNPVNIDIDVKANSNLGGTELQAIRSAQALVSRIILSFDSEMRFKTNSLRVAQNGIERVLNMGINVVIGCALFSFLIALAGIYGLVKNTIQTATQEIGTRRALGASDHGIVRTYLYRGAKQVITGFVVALLIALPIVYLISATIGFDFIQAMLFRIILVIAGLYACIIFSIYYPIKKVLQLEPSEALRYE